ncbi:MAG: M23 family metallopeptidase [Rickettsiales bacterium]|jgi:murein DD-endopeptidase MepM/ murein hydrolase activator NlpD|nr:M23 family metallopeptidase [Rickettsiales bacterium]
MIIRYEKRGALRKKRFSIFLCGFFIAAVAVLSHSSGASKGAKPLLSAQFDAVFGGMMTGIRSATLDISPGDTAASVLGSLGIEYRDIHEVSQSLKPLIKMRDLQAGSDRLKVEFVPNVSDGGDLKSRLVSLEIIRSPVYAVRAIHNDGGFVVSEDKRRVRSLLAVSGGEISKGTSLIEAATAKGIPYNIIDKFYEIFSFDIDFERDVHPGDRFDVLYERLYSSDGEYLGPGDLIYASFDMGARKGRLRLYRFENSSGQVAYYNENGDGASKTIKKTPINGARISSKFGMRRHPILGFSRAHQGVDFAAPYGAPVPAGGSGVVVSRGWRGDYGRYIRIKHNGTYSTAYGHLSAFKSGVGVGSRVSQGQIIGFVGSTGLSTGPHLHYEIYRDGRAVNPLAVKLPSISRLSQSDMDRFVVSRSRADTRFAYVAANPKAEFLPLLDDEDVVGIANALASVLVSRGQNQAQPIFLLK